MSSTYHSIISLMQYHQPTNTIYMVTPESIVTYYSQLPTSTPSPLIPQAVSPKFGSGFYSGRLLKDASYFITGGQTGEVCKLSLDFSAFSIAQMSIAVTIRVIQNRRNSNHILVLGSSTTDSKIFDIDPASLSTPLYEFRPGQQSYNMAISQIADDIVYISLPSTTTLARIGKTVMDGVDNRMVGSLQMLTQQPKNLETVPLTLLMIASEMVYMYLIDLDTFTILSSSVHAPIDTQFNLRGLSVEARIDASDIHFVFGCQRNYELS